MINNESVLTNERLQKLISQKLQELKEPNANTQSARVVFNGAKALMKSITIDIEGAKILGRPMFERTRVFLGEP